MKLALTSVALAAVAAGAAAQGRPWTEGDLLRNFHVAAYASPGICPANDAIALYSFNATGRHPSQPAVAVSGLTYSIVGFTADGRVIVLPEDQDQMVADQLAAGEETIRCVSSAARVAGATEFAVRITSVRVHPR